MAEYQLHVGFHFMVHFDFLGSEESNDTLFREVTGLKSSLKVESYDEAGEGRFTHRMPGKPQYENLVLKRGMLLNSKLHQWFKNAIENFEVETSNVRVVLRNDKDEPITQWTFFNCWPQAWSVNNLHAQQSDIMVDEITLVYDYFKRNDFTLS